MDPWKQSPVLYFTESPSSLCSYRDKSNDGCTEIGYAA